MFGLFLVGVAMGLESISCNDAVGDVGFGVRHLSCDVLNTLPSARRMYLLKKIKRQFRKRYVSFRLGLKLSLRYLPIGMKMLFLPSLPRAVMFWQECIAEGYMSGVLEEKLMHPDIGFTVAECVSIGLREDWARGWQSFYGEVITVDNGLLRRQW